MYRQRAAVFFSAALLLSAARALPKGAVTSQLEREMGSTRGFIPMNIAMEGQVDFSHLRDLTRGRTRFESREIVVRELKRLTPETQGELLTYLSDMELRGEVAQIRSLWLNNVVCCKAKREVIEDVAEMEGVRSVDLDEERPVISSLKGEQQVSSVGVEWNITRINARAAWVLGFTGQGVVVGHLDTGVNYNHTDLGDHVWTNPDEVPNNGVDDDLNGYVDDYHGYDFYYEDGDPLDDHGHGTATAGIIAGDGTGGDTTGVAPDAEVMCLKVTDWQGNAFESDVWEAIQYAIENGADVLNLSLGWLHSYNPDRAAWRNALNNSLAAGLFASVACGNERVDGEPPPYNIRTPGDVPPPWLHPDQSLVGDLSAVITVGATNLDDDIAWMSSYGPVSWEDISPWNDYPYEPEMGLIDPDVSAPGTGIVSLGVSGGYASGWNGTSFAAPHVAGATALLLSKNSEFSPAMVDSILETTSLDLGPPGKDNDYGAGRIDLVEAIEVMVDLDLDDNYPDLSGNIMHLYGAPGGEVFGRYSMVNPNSFESNADTSDGPGNCDIDSIGYRTTYLTTSGGLHHIPPENVSPNLLTVDELASGQSAQNLLKVIIPDGLPSDRTFTGEVEVTAWAYDLCSTDSFILKVTLLPLRLRQNYPNPFRETTEIHYLIPSDSGKVSLQVYNLAGELVKTLMDELKEGGYDSASWNATDNSGRAVASGVYFYRIQAGRFTEAKKMILLK